MTVSSSELRELLSLTNCILDSCEKESTKLSDPKILIAFSKHHEKSKSDQIKSDNQHPAGI